MVRWFLLSLILISCSSNNATTQKDRKVKNVILMIGDGMGPGQISLLYYFAKYSKLNVVAPEEFAFEKIAAEGSFGTSATEPYDKIVADSACSATQLATGKSARSEMIGLDKDGNTTLTILEKAQRKGLKTGLVSDTRLTHATPAAFASHVANRWSEDDIAEHMVANAPDVMFSGGANRFVPKGTNRHIKGAFNLTSKRKDNKDLIQQAIDKGHQVVFSKSELENLSDKKVLGLFTDYNYPNGIWFSQHKNDPERTIPTLLEMSKAAIEKLSKSPKGYFLMIEGGQIDWAGHQNDVATMLHEMITFNETLNWVIEHVKKNPDTLLVVTADHETGSFGFSYNIHDLPHEKKLKGDAFIGKSFKPFFNYGDFSVVDKLYKQKMSLIDLWYKFTKLPEQEQNPRSLQAMVEQATNMKFTLEDAKRVLADGPNRYFNKDHPLLNKKVRPHIHEFDSFHYQEDNMRTGLIASGLSAQQSAVWGTGGHTAAPVHLYSMGPREVTDKLSGYLHHAQVGEILQEALGIE